MVGYFVDSSALVKRYVNETGSVWLSGLVAPAAGNDIYIARITTVEVIVGTQSAIYGVRRNCSRPRFSDFSWVV